MSIREELINAIKTYESNKDKITKATVAYLGTKDYRDRVEANKQIADTIVKLSKDFLLETKIKEDIANFHYFFEDDEKNVIACERGYCDNTHEWFGKEKAIALLMTGEYSLCSYPDEMENCWCAYNNTIWNLEYLLNFGLKVDLEENIKEALRRNKHESELEGLPCWLTAGDTALNGKVKINPDIIAYDRMTEEGLRYCQSGKNCEKFTATLKEISTPINND